MQIQFDKLGFIHLSHCISHYETTYRVNCPGNTKLVHVHLIKTNRLIHRGSDMSAHVLLNLLNELGKSDKMGGILFHFDF